MQRPLRRGIGEVQRDGRSFLLCLAAGVEVRLQDQIGPRRQLHRNALGVLLRHRPGHVPAEHRRGGQPHPPEAGLAIEAVPLHGCPGLVVVEEHMMHHAPRRRLELDRGDVPVFRQVHRQREPPVDVAAVGRNGERRVHFEHEIGRAESPAGFVQRRFRGRREIAAWRIRFDPREHRRFLVGGQPPVVQQLRARRRRPRRHVVFQQHRFDRPAVLAGVLKTEQIERPRLPRLVTPGAFGVQDRGHVPGIRRSIGGHGCERKKE